MNVFPFHAYFPWFKPNYLHIKDRGRGDRHVEIIWGGAFGHWGLLVGPPEYELLDVTLASDTRRIRRMWSGFLLL